MCYSLNQDRMYEVKVTDKHTAESLTHFSLKKDDLVMADAGYGTAHNYIYAQEHQAEKARKRKKRTAVRKQKQITDDTLFCAGWVVVITSLGAGYCGEEILHLYRSRWQVELLFKRFKQNFSVTFLKAGNTNFWQNVSLLEKGKL